MPFNIDNTSHFRAYGSHPIFLPELVTKTKKTKTGEVMSTSIELVNQCKDLPELEEYDYQTLIDAGVPLKQVGSKMFDAGHVYVEAGDEKDSHLSGDGEKNDDNDANKGE